MLTRLHIRNYAIIKEVDISFQKGLTIITGETGAGKSILMGALSLVLGERADLKSLFTKEEKCIIEGHFDIQKIAEAKLFLNDQDLDSDDELIIRREIHASGKSRVFINDTPVTLQTLSGLSSLLIDLHRQFDTQELQQSSQHLQIIDEVCRHKNMLQEYRIIYKKWKTLQYTYQQLLLHNKQIKQELDYNQFLYNELESFSAKADELEAIENELFILNNSEALKSNLQHAVMVLKNQDNAVLTQLKTVSSQLENHSAKIQVLKEIQDRLQSAYIELKEIGNELEDLFEQTQPDAEKMQILNDRLNEGNRLLKKHNVQNDIALLDIQKSLEEKILHAVHADDEAQKISDDIQIQFALLNDIAERLSSNRKKIIPETEKNVNALLAKVGMANASIKIELVKTDFNENGMDKADILFDANKTGKFSSVAKIASGGELSRLMLCIKSLLAHGASLPTLIFDEIDSGISGETALQVGAILKDLSKHHQLICITHLPQIAGKANQHIYIYKEESTDGSMHTRLKILDDTERIEVLAEMLGGKTSSTQAKEMVKQLMDTTNL